MVLPRLPLLLVGSLVSAWVLPGQTTVTTEAELNAAIAAGNAGGTKHIVFGNDIAASSGITAIEGLGTWTIDGAGFHYDAAFASHIRSFVVLGGDVTFQDLTVQRTSAEGGEGGGGDIGGGGGGGGIAGNGEHGVDEFTPAAGGTGWGSLGQGGDGRLNSASSLDGGDAGFGGGGGGGAGGEFVHVDSGVGGLGGFGGGNGGNGVGAFLGGHGGGGLGAGGGILVLNNGASPKVTLRNVHLDRNAAFGGNAGNFHSSDAEGGDGLGGSVFVMGAQASGTPYTLQLQGGGSQSASGAGVFGGAGATRGRALGSGYFLQGYGTLNVTNTTGETLTINDVITDEAANPVGGGGTGSTGGSWSLEKHGTGTLVLNGANTYSAATAVHGGIFLNHGSLTSATTVHSGATLGGTGTFTGLVTLNSGGHLAPGNSPGTTTYTGGLTINDGGVFDFELGTTSDLILVTGGTLTGPASFGGAIFNFTDAGGFTAGTYDLINGSGATLSGFDLTDFAVGSGIGGYDFSFGLSGNVLQVTAGLSAVPEPSAAALLLGLGTLGVVVLRRRRR